MRVFSLRIALKSIRSLVALRLFLLPFGQLDLHSIVLVSYPKGCSWWMWLLSSLELNPLLGLVSWVGPNPECGLFFDQQYQRLYRQCFYNKINKNKNIRPVKSFLNLRNESSTEILERIKAFN